MQTDSNIRVFQFFRTGRHISMGGQTTEWTPADLEQICRNYASQPTAPLVLGHPADDGPAFGEAKELFHKNGALYAIARCSKALIDLVRSGYYKHVSAKFAPALGHQSGWNLRHIGFLGAMAPAVKGLAPLQFSESMVEPRGTLCFATGPGMEEGALESAAEFRPPRGWRADPGRLRLHQLAANVHAGCPSMSFSEAAVLADRLIKSCPNTH